MEQKVVWDTLADSWTNLRIRPYEEVIDFSESENKEPILDIGCGNCRNLVPFLEKGKRCIGIDFSEKMIKSAKMFLGKRNLKAKLKVGNMVKLPFKDKSVGTIICNASLHSLSLESERFKSLYEMERVLKKDGRMLLSVWYRYQKRFFRALLANIFKRNKFDISVEWNYHGKKYERLYHLYSKRELRKDINFASLKIEKMWTSKGNLWALVRK
jgi:ubiquinone/menaquinone biosynthesis C-methylase UbiE